MMNNVASALRPWRHILLGCFVSYGVCANPIALNAAEVKWRNATEDAGQEYQAAKLFVMYFHADWCNYCTKLDTDVFQTPEFQALGDKAMFIKVDDKDDARSSRVQLEEKLKIESYPTLVVLKRVGANFEATGSIVGYHPADEYLTLLRPLLGVPNPEKQPVPNTFAGQGLTPNSNLCQPGDFQCIIGQLSPPKAKPFSGLEEFLKPMPPTETKESAGQVLTDTSLVELIKGLGYTVETASPPEKSTVYRFTQTEDGWDFPTQASFSSNKTKLWLTVNLGPLRAAEELPSGKLLKFLEFNHSYGPTTFSIVNGSLTLNRCIDNVGVTKDAVAAALSELRRVPRETYGVWQELRAAATTQ